MTLCSLVHKTICTYTTYFTFTYGSLSGVIKCWYSFLTEERKAKSKEQYSTNKMFQENSIYTRIHFITSLYFIYLELIFLPYDSSNHLSILSETESKLSEALHLFFCEFVFSLPDGIHPESQIYVAD